MIKTSKYLLILLILVLFFVQAISSMGSKKKTIEEMIADSTLGWGGNPELIQKGRSPLEATKKEFYYHKGISKASQKAIESGSAVQKQTSCSDAASLAGKYEILMIFMDSILKEKNSSEEDGNISLYFDESNFITCKFSTSEDRKKKSRNCTGEIQSFGTAECWSNKNNYEECGCLVYFKYNGGKESAFRNIKIKE